MYHGVDKGVDTSGQVDGTKGAVDINGQHERQRVKTVSAGTRCGLSIGKAYFTVLPQTFVVNCGATVGISTEL